MTEKRQLFIKEFEQLFKENYENMYHYAYAIVDDIELSRDLVGEVFSCIWDNFDTLNQEQIKGYLIISVRNKCIDWLREQEKGRAFQTLWIENLKSCSEACDSNEKELQEIERVLSSMSPRAQLVLERHYYYQKTYKEVAEEMDISVRMVKRIIMNALEEFRDNFNLNKGLL